MSTSIKRILALVKQAVVCVVWANNQISRVVIQLVPIDVVNKRSLWQLFAQCFFSNKNVLKTLLSICVDQFVAIAAYCSGAAFSLRPGVRASFAYKRVVMLAAKAFTPLV